MSRACLALTVALGFYMFANQLVVLAQRTDKPSAAKEPQHLPWGREHVEEGFPDYVTGDECLFCHRDIGTTWPRNAHQRTMRPAEKNDLALRSLAMLAGGNKFAPEVDLLLGEERFVRYLKRSKQYGRVEMLSATHDAAVGKIEGDANWDENKFADRCAGCHATAVDTATRAFSATSIDCVSCHGVVDLAHSKNTTLVLLSDQNRDPKQVVSICAQCHLRGGQSKSSGLPYPNSFVAGDNLFLDFDVDLSDDAIHQLPPADRHIFENVRDVELLRNTQVTCLSCHSVHQQSTAKHQELSHSDRCMSCHGADSEKSTLTEAYKATKRAPKSNVCEYSIGHR